ncbi:MAG TPA: ABC transporter permease [Candidatus Angelobacter sp.]|nr:ABC transporter permease [Candidatus Angelobacter sp.]
MMESILQDLRYELRALLNSPRFTSIALITLVLGIAANVTIFTFVDAALIRPLPYRDASRLMEVYDTRSAEVFTQFESSYPDYLDWRTQQQVFDGLAGYGQNQVLLRGGGAPELLPSAAITDNFFQTIGVQPLMGRDFRVGEDQATAPRMVMISYGWWQRHFGGKNVIGQVLSLDNEPNTIIGVLPADFHFAPVGDPDVFETLHATGALLTRRNLHWLSVVGRLKPGITRQSAGSAMNLIAQGLEKQYPQSNDRLRTVIVPLNEVIVGEIRPILLLLLGAVGLLLLIACANVANLLLARSLARRNEMAIRSALGASRARLMGLMLTEGLILSFTGAVAGLAVAYWTIKGFVAMIPAVRIDAMPYLKHMSIDARVLLFALLLAIVTGIVFALAPALQASGANVQSALKDGSRGSHSGPWRRFASALVIGEVALAMVLLAGSGLLVKSLYRLLNVNPGFDQRNLLGMMVGLSQSHFPQQDAQRLQAHQNLLDRIRALPGVQSVGLSDVLPVSNGGNTSNLRVVGQPSETPQGREANSRTVSRTYFQTLGAELAQGSWFTEADNMTDPQRVIINQTLADKFMAGLDPLKQQILFTYSPTEKPRQVIGVVRDIKEGPLDTPARPAIYTPMEPRPNLFFNVILRTAQHPDALVTEVQNAVRQVDPDAITFNVQTMEDRIQRSPAAFLHRYPAVLAGVFAFLALLLGTIGLYGLVAYSVSQRTREIGIRMALGAQRGNVLQMILSQGMRLIVSGVVIGVIAAMVSSYLMRSMLFGIRSWDPVIFVAVTAILAIVTLAASYIPARSATKVDPMVALRYE